MNGMLLNFIVSLVVCLIGFRKYVYFLSVGYGFSVAAIGIAMFVKYFIVESVTLPWFILAQLLLFAVYGIRLGYYVLARDIKSDSYREKLKTATKNSSKDILPMPVMISMWILVAALYMVQTCPAYYRIENTRHLMVGSDIFRLNDGFGIAGVLVMAIGFVLEAIADKQKSLSKKENPKRFCDMGLYRICRCPNYFGEITFWTGVFVSGLDIYRSWVEWTLAIAGYLCIVYIMFNGAKRLEKRQNSNYGEDPEYQAYIKKTPLIIPLIPIYSLQDSKFIK